MRATTQARRDTVIVFAGGDAVDATLADHLPPTSVTLATIAADSGLHQATIVNREVTHIVGDLDSVDAQLLADAADRGAQVMRYPAAKNETDLELALDLAREVGAARIVVAGGHGGRLDHLLGNVAVIAAAASDKVRVEALSGSARVTVVTDSARLSGATGSLVSLLAIGAPARGVTTAGLRFALHGDDLVPGTSRGVSNEFIEPIARVSISSGTVIAVQPDALGRQPRTPRT